MPHHADHFHPRHALYDRNAEALADRAFVTEHLTRHAIVENADGRAALELTIPEPASCQKRNSQRAEILRARRARVDTDLRVLPFVLDLHRLRLPTERQAIDHRR